jgi:MFS family permease
MTMQLCDIAMLLPMGFIADRLPKARVLGVVILVLGAGTLLVAFGDLALMRLGCVVVGAGMAGWMLPLGVLRRETPPDRIAWRTALYRVAVDGGIFLGPFLSGLIGRGHLGVLPAATASVLLVIGLTLLTTARSATMAPASERSPAK